ncbi:DeoR family transcriptional regulator [Candidatus Woesearchaeota archaeon]|nr:DeoR family transcriptional regulator [Candidatus Woesearchaeota archaeon]
MIYFSYGTFMGHLWDIIGPYTSSFIEKFGSGIQMINEISKEFGIPKPAFEKNPVETKIVFRPLDDKWKEDAVLNERQEKELEYIREKGSITNKEYREINDVSNKTAFQDLVELLEKGLVAKKGRGRSSQYILR